MKTLHTSRNLEITYDEATLDLSFIVRFHDESVTGKADGSCPMCGGASNVVLWELEGPDGDSNTVWLTCAQACAERNGEVRWSRPVEFDGHWSGGEPEE